MIDNNYSKKREERLQKQFESNKKKYSFMNESVLFDPIYYDEKSYGIINEHTIDITVSDNIKIFKLINKKECIVCNKVVCYLGHCIEHINNINVNDLYNNISAIYYDCNTHNHDKGKIKIYIMMEFHKLKRIIDIVDNVNKYNERIDRKKYYRELNEQVNYYSIKLEHDILVDLFTNKQFTIEKQLINKYKLFFKIIDNELLKSHIHDIDINKCFLIDTKIHMCDVMMKIITIQEKVMKLAIDFNNYPSSLDNINKHRNINKDKYYKNNNYSIIKVDLVNDNLTDSIINKVINKILCIVIFNKNINYISDNYKKDHTIVTKLSFLENKKYMDNIKLSIMEKAQLYDNSKNYIYVLKLINNNYYVGRTKNIHNRMKQHTNYIGSFFTKTYKPIDLIEVTYDLHMEDENIKTREMMRLFGHKNVRGGSWCQLDLINPPIL